MWKCVVKWREDRWDAHRWQDQTGSRHGSTGANVGIQAETKVRQSRLGTFGQIETQTAGSRVIKPQSVAARQITQGSRQKNSLKGKPGIGTGSVQVELGTEEVGNRESEHRNICTDT